MHRGARRSSGRTVRRGCRDVGEAGHARADRGLRDWAERVIGDPGWTSLEVEFAVHARPNEELRTELAGRLDGILQMLTAAVESADTPALKMPVVKPPPSCSRSA